MEQNKQDTGNESIPKTTSGKTYNVGATLDKADDAAHVNMGGIDSKWRMPKENELAELISNTDYAVIKDKGMLFTSKINGHQLFIPFAGYWYNGSFDALGSNANVWSSQVHSSNVDGAFTLICNSSGNADVYIDSRTFAFSVRGVFQV